MVKYSISSITICVGIEIVKEGRSVTGTGTGTLGWVWGLGYPVGSVCVGGSGITHTHTNTCTSMHTRHAPRWQSMVNSVLHNIIPITYCASLGLRLLHILPQSSVVGAVRLVGGGACECATAAKGMGPIEPCPMHSTISDSSSVHSS